MNLKKSAFCVLAVCAFSMPFLASCGSTSSSVAASSAGSSSEAESSSSSAFSYPESGLTVDDLSTSQTVTMSCYYQDAKTAMKFHTDSKVTLPYNAADGTTYNDGDFKPVWKQVQSNLNMTIDDVTNYSGGNIAATFKTMSTALFKSGNKDINIAQGNASDIVKEGITNSSILDLRSYLDVMPNFRAYLEANPVIRSSILDADGHMYYAPYFDGFDDLERMLIVRKDWVEKLLDTTTPTFDTAKTITSSYTRFGAATADEDIDILKNGAKSTVHKTYTSGNDIISIQNALSTKNGSTLTTALRSYIHSAYNGAYDEKPSELFVGGKAAYNVDELVALYRCVVTNPGLLTGDASKVIVPLYPREQSNQRTTDLWRFMSFFGVRGVDSRLGYLYVGTDGKLHDARGEQSTANALEKMNQMYNEGLILQNFNVTTATSGGKGKFRDDLNANNQGFSTFDYCQTTTALNSSSSEAAIENFALVPCMPAVYDWEGNGKEFHYSESWRSVKAQGWFITAQTASNTAVLKRALYLFDYFWGTEGSKLMSYGPSAWIDGTTTYKGTTVPKLSDKCITELSQLADNNYTNYYRYYLGGTFPIGYIKEQGMEYQTVNAKAKGYLDEIETAIAADVLKHPNFKTDNTNHLYDIVPTTVAYQSGEQTSISNNFTDLDAYCNVESSGSNIFTNITMSGFAGADSTKFTSAATYLTYVNTTLKLTQYLVIVELAYDRMGL